MRLRHFQVMEGTRRECKGLNTARDLPGNWDDETVKVMGWQERNREKCREKEEIKVLEVS